MPAYSLGRKVPRVHPTVLLAPTSTIIGDAVIGARTSIWPGAVIRADYGYIRIGPDCSIQDNAVVHCSAENPTIIGRGVTVAHSAVVHACRVGDECLIGVGALVFDGASIGKQTIVGVGSTVLGGVKIPPRSVAVGSPAKIIRRSTPSDLKLVKDSYKAYVGMSRIYLKLAAFEKAVS